MNIVNIRQNTNSKMLKCFINHELINTYNDLSTIINGNISNFVNNIFTNLDDEIFDEYELHYEGVKFVDLFLNQYKCHSQFCKKYIFTRTIDLADLTEVSGQLEELSHQYHIENSDLKDDYFYVNNETDYQLSSKYQEKQNGQIIISKERNSSYLYNIVVSNDLKIVYENNHYIIYIPLEELDLFFEYYEILYEIDKIEYLLKNLKEVDLKKKDQQILNYITEKEPQFYISDIPTVIEKGKEIKIEFISLPQNNFNILYNGQIYCDETRLIALENGEGTVQVTNQMNKIVFEQTVMVISHNYVNEIRILKPLNNLIVHKKEKIELLLLPDNAEDIHDIEYIIEPASFAVITKYKEIIPLQSGNCKLIIKSKKVTKEIDISIKNDLQNFEFEQPKYNLSLGQSIVIPLKITPDLAKTEQLQWTFDNMNIAHITPSVKHDKCKVIAGNELTGVGNLRCYDPITQKSKYCSITVSKAPKLPIGTIIVTIIILFMLMICCSM